MRRSLIKPSNTRLERPVRLIGKQPNPYLIAVMTAVLAGLFSIVGGYFVAGFQARHATEQKQLEYRANAYGTFVDKIDRSRSPAISEVLNIGTMAEVVATDMEIQIFENRIVKILRKHNAEDLYWQLNADLNVLRLHGSDRVSNISSDILLALTLRDHQIDWSVYPPDVVAFHDRWKAAQEGGIAYAWKERVSADERLMLITVAKLTQVLLLQMNRELRGEEPNRSSERTALGKPRSAAQLQR